MSHDILTPEQRIAAALEDVAEQLRHLNDWLGTALFDIAQKLSDR